MDRGDRISSPSAPKTRLVEKRMEMVSRLTNQINEETYKKRRELAEKEKQKDSLRESIKALAGVGKVLNVIYRMFT